MCTLNDVPNSSPEYGGRPLELTKHDPEASCRLVFDGPKGVDVSSHLIGHSSGHGDERGIPSTQLCLECAAYLDLACPLCWIDKVLAVPRPHHLRQEPYFFGGCRTEKLFKQPLRVARGRSSVCVSVFGSVDVDELRDKGFYLFH